MEGKRCGGRSVFLSMLSLSNVMLVGKAVVAVVGMFDPSVYGLVVLVCLVFLQRRMAYKLVGAMMALVYLRMLLGTFLGLEIAAGMHGAIAFEGSEDKAACKCCSGGGRLDDDGCDESDYSDELYMHFEGGGSSNGGRAGDVQDVRVRDRRRMRCPTCLGTIS